MRYDLEQVVALLDQAVENAEQSIFAGLHGADNEQRLDSLDTLDALDAVHKQLRILIDLETSNE